MLWTGKEMLCDVSDRSELEERRWKIDGSREGRGEQCQIDGGSLKKIVRENYPCQSICTHVHLSTLYSLLNVY